MRDRDEIQTQVKDARAKLGIVRTPDHHALFIHEAVLEVLLDIRDLLIIEYHKKSA